MTPFFAHPTPEDGKVIAFAIDIHLGLLPATVVVKPECLTPGFVNVEYMEALLSHLTPGHPQLPPETPRPYRVSVPRVSLVPLSLLHPLMVSPFLLLATVWHMMHTKAYAMGMNQQVAQLLDWLRAATVDPQLGIAALTSVDLVDATLPQRQGIRMSPVPPPPHH